MYTDVTNDPRQFTLGTGAAGRSEMSTDGNFLHRFDNIEAFRRKGDLPVMILPIQLNTAYYTQAHHVRFTVHTEMMTLPNDFETNSKPPSSRKPSKARQPLPSQTSELSHRPLHNISACIEVFDANGRTVEEITSTVPGIPPILQEKNVTTRRTKLRFELEIGAQSKKSVPGGQTVGHLDEWKDIIQLLRDVSHLAFDEHGKDIMSTDEFKPSGQCARGAKVFNRHDMCDTLPATVLTLGPSLGHFAAHLNELTFPPGQC